MCMVTTGHLITIKISPGDSEGMGKDKGAVAPLLPLWRRPCFVAIH